MFPGQNKKEPTKEEVLGYVRDVKQVRLDIDKLITKINNDFPSAKGTSMAVTKLTEGGMWCGKVLAHLRTTYPQFISEPKPYQGSRDPNNLTIEAPYDGIQN